MNIPVWIFCTNFYKRITFKKFHEWICLPIIFYCIFPDLYPGAKVFPKSLIETLGQPNVSPDAQIKSKILVDSVINRCNSLRPNAAYCPGGWTLIDDKIFDSDGEKRQYCLKNAGLSYGNEDLCQVGEFGKLGAHRIRLPMKGTKQHNVVQYTT